MLVRRYPLATYGGALIASLLAWLALALVAATPVRAESGYTVVTETIETIEYGLALPETRQNTALAQFGPFLVVAPDRIEMTGTVDSYSPDEFRALLARYPGIARIDMVDCDGSVDEEANLQLARMIRRAGIATHVPAHGSIRSGAVELFLAGVSRSADPSAEFIVHSWMDEDGYQANDYPANDPVHREYLDYYAEMGVPADKARAFYALTNSVPFEQQLHLSRADLQQFAFLH